MQRYITKNLAWLGPLCVIASLGVGVLIGKTIAPPAAVFPKPLRESGYRYINPVLLCNQDPNQDFNEDKTLASQLTSYIENNHNDTVSVYFLNLTNPGWAGINENEAYSPASMLKVTTMVAILKYAESHADFLSKKIYYDGSFDDTKAEYFKPQQTIKPGRSYTVDDLLGYMIKYSDNNASRLLNGAIDQQSLTNIYLNLGIHLPVEVGADFMSAKTYSLFLRVLYNSTYLSRDMSEKAMGLMTAPDFPPGLQAGIPPSVTAAQKFGERQVFSPDGALLYRELHDCGIIYHPKGPYVLCVMTKGQDFASLAAHIHDISKLVYDRVSQE